jgi:hypothetical protein
MPAKVEEPPTAPKVEVAPPTPPPAPRPEPKPAAADLPPADPNKVVTVPGLDAERQSNLFFVATRDPVVLFKKLRSDPGDGTRIELVAGAQRRFYISESEVVRVARGKNLEMFFQGRKVSASTLLSGAWISFVPLAEEKAATAPPPPPSQQQ